MENLNGNLSLGFKNNFVISCVVQLGVFILVYIQYMEN